MIPREILKKIRQIELRTNRLVTEFAAGARASARFTARTPGTSKANLALNSIRELKRRERRATAVPERGCVQSTSRSTPDISNAPTNHHALRLGLRPQPRSGILLTPDFSPVIGDGESFNRFNGFPRARKPLKRLEFVSRVHTGLKPGVNERGLGAGFCVNNEANQSQPNFFLASALTCSHGMPRSGCFRNSSARRSSSTICSGVSSSSNSVNSSRICWTTSLRSFSGNCRICPSSSAAFMAEIYSGNICTQATFSVAPFYYAPRITHHASRRP